MSMVKINNCGECPFFEWFLNEPEDGPGGSGKLIGKGRCHLKNPLNCSNQIEEIWETRCPCNDGNIDDSWSSIEDMKRAVTPQGLEPW